MKRRDMNRHIEGEINIMKLRKSLLVGMALVGAMTFVGCGKTADVKPGPTEKPEAGVEVEETDEVTDLTFFYYDGLRVYKQDSPIWMAIQEATNVNLKGVAPTTAGGDQDEQFNLMLASGDIPDIINATKPNIMKNGDKLVQPLEGLIAEHAPNLQKFLDENPNVLAAASGTDGHLYTIPYLPDGQVSEMWYIRKDWLNKFDLEIPTTVEEYENAIRTFREKDANGNGKQDEIGYFDRDNKEGISGLFNLYGASFIPYIKDGVVQDDRYTEGFKDSVANVARIYADGLIDPEIYTRGKDSRDVMFQQNAGASTVDWTTSTATFQAKYEDQIEGLEWVSMLPPVNTKGESMIQYSRNNIAEWGWSISKNSKNPVAAIKLFDYMFTEEGRRVMNFGIEGETYTMVDGKAIFKDEILNMEVPVNQHLQDIGQILTGYQQDFEYEKQWTEESALQAIENYMAAEPFLETVEGLSLSQTSEEIELISKKEPALKSYTAEMVQKWVLGSEDIDKSFDAYLKKANEMGAQEIIAAYQAAYDRAYK